LVILLAALNSASNAWLLVTKSSAKRVHQSIPSSDLSPSTLPSFALQAEPFLREKDESLQPSSCSRQSLKTRRQSVLETTRRLALLLFAAAVLPCDSAHAEDSSPKPLSAAKSDGDPLAAFGERLQNADIFSQQQQQWSSSAASPAGPSAPSSPERSSAPVSDMEQALQQSKQKKRIDPRTHG